MKSLSSNQIGLGTLALLLPGAAHANAGVPMLFLAMPAFAIALLPIIIVEVLYLSKTLNLSMGHSAKTVTISNFASTIVGVPLTWFLLVLIQMVTGGGSAYGVDTTLGKILAVTWQAPWLIPYEEELAWMIPIAGVVLLIPFFFASWWSEYFVTKHLLPECSPENIRIKVRNANLITYSLLTLWPIGMLVFDYISSSNSI